ncbi:MAG: transglycosylase domain-containing protein, partial [Acetobacteraceae bacterium]
MFGPLKAGEPLTRGSRPAPENSPQPRRKPPVARRSLWRWPGRIVGALFAVLLLAGLAGLIGLYGVYRVYTADLPDVDGLKHFQPAVMGRIYANDGELMQELATERRIFTRFAAIPVEVRKAFLAAEDQNFWRHGGVDPLAIIRAALTDMQHLGEHRRPVGASTITQQLAKNMLLGNEVSLRRKLREAILAIRIEKAMSKQRILELYLNEIYLGQQSYGVTAAAQTYFDKPLDRLTLAEAALLAALPKAPNNYNPVRNPEAARMRRDWVLDRMADDHDITPAQAAVAKAEPIRLQLHKSEPLAIGQYFTAEVRHRLIEDFGAGRTTRDGFMVRTSMDP